MSDKTLPRPPSAVILDNVLPVGSSVGGHGPNQQLGLRASRINLSGPLFDK